MPEYATSPPVVREPGYAQSASSVAPGARRRKNGTQVIGSGAVTVVTLDTTVFNTGLTVSSDRITIPTGEGGIYLVGVGLLFAAATSGLRNLQARLNGAASYVVDVGITASTTTRLAGTNLVELAEGDYLQLTTYVDGANVTVGGTGVVDSWLFAIKQTTNPT